MKLTVKTLKGNHFEIRVQPSDTVMAVKKNIEDIQGKDNYPCGQQLLIHNGKVLKDETTLAENKVSEDGFLVVMLSKSKTLSSAGAFSAQPANNTSTTVSTKNSLTTAPEPSLQNQAATNSSSATDVRRTNVPTDTYGQAASSLAVGSELEQTIQQIIDIGDGNWDRETVTRALRAAYNNPERAVDYLYSGIPEAAEVAVPVAHYPASQTGGATAVAVSGATNMFPPFQEEIPAEGELGSLDYLRNNPQFQALRSIVQSNPTILQSVLQELGKQNPQLLEQIQEHHDEFLRLINEPVESSEGDIYDHLEQEMPHSVNVTQEDQDAIARLEAMGFAKSLVIEAFLACDRNEQLAANYLLEHARDFED